MQATSDPERRSCERHGAYESRLLPHVNRWTACPKCVAEERRQEEREAEEQRTKQAAAAARERDARLMAEACIPPRFIGRTLQNFRCPTPEHENAMRVAQEFVGNFGRHCRLGTFLVFAGPVGTGKTHLAVGVMQALAGKAVRYTVCMDLIRRVRETWRRDSPVSESELLRHFVSLDLLVIDELGVQYGSDGERNTLFDVIDGRYRNMRPTILLTNEEKPGLRALLGDRISDRLSEVADWVPFSGESQRRQARKESRDGPNER